MDLNGQIGAAEFDQLESLADFVISEDSVDSRRTGIVQKEDRSERPVAIITPHSAIQSKEVHLQQDSLRYPSMDNEHFYRRSTSRERNERYRFYGSPRRFSPSQPRTPSPRRFSVSPRRFSPGRPCSPNRPRTGSRPRTPNRPLTPSRPRTPSPNYYRGDRVGANNTNESFERFRVAPPPDPVPVPPYDGSISRQYDEPRPLSPRTDEDWYTAVNCFQFLCENVPVRRKRDPRYSRSRSRSRTRSRSPARRRRRRRSYSRGSADGRFKKMKSRSSRTSSSSSSSSSSASDTDADKKSKGYSTQKSLPERDEDDFTNTQKREAMTKQRDDYLLQLLGLEAEVDRLKKQQQTLSARDPDTNSLFLIENVRLQGVLSGNIASIRTAVEKMNNMFNLPAPENPPLTKDGLPVSAQPIDKVDTGRPWCQYCNVFPLSLKALLIHYSSVAHRRKLQEHGVAEDPWINDIDPEEEKAAIDCMVIEQLVGYQFVLPADGWYCQLCHIWFGDHRTATIHMYSPDHVKGYTTFSENHSEWTQEWTSCRKTALDNYDEKSAVTDETDQKKRTQWKEDGMRLDGMRSALKREDNSRENSKKRSTNRKTELNKIESPERVTIHNKPVVGHNISKPVVSHNISKPVVSHNISKPVMTHNISKPVVSHNISKIDADKKIIGSENIIVVDQWHPDDVPQAKDTSCAKIKWSPAVNNSKFDMVKQQYDKTEKVIVKERPDETKVSNNKEEPKKVSKQDMREGEQKKREKDSEQRHKVKDIEREKPSMEKVERDRNGREDQRAKRKERETTVRETKEKGEKEKRHRRRVGDKYDKRDKQSYSSDSRHRHRERSVRDQPRHSGRHHRSRSIDSDRNRNKSKQPVLNEIKQPVLDESKQPVSDEESPKLQKKRKNSETENSKSTKLTSGMVPSVVSNKWRAVPSTDSEVPNPTYEPEKSTLKYKKSTDISGEVSRREEQSPESEEDESSLEEEILKPVVRPIIGKMPMLRKLSKPVLSNLSKANIAMLTAPLLPSSNTAIKTEKLANKTLHPFFAHIISKKSESDSPQANDSNPTIIKETAPVFQPFATDQWSKKTDVRSADATMLPISSIPEPMPPASTTTKWPKKTWMPQRASIPEHLPTIPPSIPESPAPHPVVKPSTRIQQSKYPFELPTQLNIVPMNDLNKHLKLQQEAQQNTTVASDSIVRENTSCTINTRKQLYDNFFTELHSLQGISKWVRELGFDIRVPVVMQPGENSFELFYRQVILTRLVTDEEAVRMRVKNSKIPKVSTDNSAQDEIVNGFDRYSSIILIPEQIPFILFYIKIVKPLLVLESDIRVIQGRCRDNNPPASYAPMPQHHPSFYPRAPRFPPRHFFQPRPPFPPF